MAPIPDPDPRSQIPAPDPSSDARARDGCGDEVASAEAEPARQQQGLFLLESPPAQPDVDLGRPANAEQKRVVDRWLPLALEVLDALNDARRRANSNARSIRPTYASLAKIAERLEAKRTREECLVVIENCAAAILAGDEKGEEYFDSISPFRVENFERKLAMLRPRQARASPDGDRDERRYKNFSPPRAAVALGQDVDI